MECATQEAEAAAQSLWPFHRADYRQCVHAATGAFSCLPTVLAGDTSTAAQEHAGVYLGGALQSPRMLHSTTPASNSTTGISSRGSALQHRSAGEKLTALVYSVQPADVKLHLVGGLKHHDSPWNSRRAPLPSHSCREDMLALHTSESVGQLWIMASNRPRRTRPPW